MQNVSIELTAAEMADVAQLIADSGKTSGGWVRDLIRQQISEPEGFALDATGGVFAERLYVYQIGVLTMLKAENAWLDGFPDKWLNGFDARYMLSQLPYPFCIDNKKNAMYARRALDILTRAGVFISRNSTGEGEFFLNAKPDAIDADISDLENKVLFVLMDWANAGGAYKQHFRNLTAYVIFSILREEKDGVRSRHFVSRLRGRAGLFGYPEACGGGTAALAEIVEELINDEFMKRISTNEGAKYILTEKGNNAATHAAKFTMFEIGELDDY